MLLKYHFSDHSSVLSMFLALEKTHLREIYFPPTFCFQNAW